MLAAAATVDVKKMLVYLKEQLMSVLHYTHTHTSTLANQNISL